MARRLKKPNQRIPAELLRFAPDTRQHTSKKSRTPNTLTNNQYRHGGEHVVR